MVKLRRVWKIFKWTLGILLILIVIGGFVLAIPSVQTRLAREAANYLQDEYGVEVTIESAAIQLPGTVYLKGVYAPDHRNDTLIFAEEIKFEFNGFNNNHLKAGEVALAGGGIQMRKYEGDDLYNFAIWLEHFNDTTTYNGPPFQLSIADAQLSDFDYYKHPFGCEECTWIDVYDGEFRVSDFHLIGSYFEGEVEQFSYRDETRFSLHSFTGFASYSQGSMELTDLAFKTDDSEVEGWARLEFEDLSDFSDFVNVVKMKGEFRSATVKSEEFQSYIPEFPNFDTFTFKGEFSGTVNDLQTTKVDATLGSTHFYGDVSLLDCTEPSIMHIDAFIGRCNTVGADLQKYLPQFLDNNPLPSEVEKFTAVTLNGHFEGTLESFNSEGSFQTNLGDARVDVKFSNLDQLEIATYEGEVDFRGFNFGELLEVEDLQKVSAKGSVQGIGLTPSTTSAKLDLTSSSVQFRKTDINNLSVEGVVADRRFNGDFHIHDELLNVDFDGLLDFTKDTAALSFTARIDSSDLHSVGLIEDTVSWFAASVDADFALYKTEWWQGSVKIDDITYRRADEVFAYDEVFLNSSNAGSITRNEIASDFMDGKIEGEYQLLKVYQPILGALASVNQHYPFEEEPSFIDCDYELVLKKTDVITRLILPGVRFAPGTRLRGALRSRDQYLDVRLTSPGMDLYGTYFDSTEVKLKGRSGRYSTSVNIKSVFTSENFETDELRLKATMLPDSTLIDFQTLLKDSVDSDMHFEGYVLQPSEKTFDVHWNQAVFNVGLDTLTINPFNRLRIEGNRFIVDNYAFQGNNGELYLNGVLSPEPYEILRARLVDLDLSIVNYLLREPNTYFRGQAQGMVFMNDLFNHPSVGGRLEVDSLILNEQQLGHLNLNIDWDIQNNVQRLDGGITLGTRQTFAVSGRIAQDSANPLLINLDLSRFRLSAFNPYLLGVLDNLRGTVEGSIQIAGTLAKPTMDGQLKLPNAAFSIPFLGTDYNFEGSPIVHLSSNRILLDRVKIRDTKEQTVGYASGVVNHRNLSDLNFDIEIDADKLLGMDLKAGENEYFYGKAFASGKVRIIGPTDQMNLRIDVEAEEGTAIRLPLSGSTEVGRSDFITFVDPTEKEDSTAFGFRREVKVDDLGGLSITVNANMKPEAEVRLVMDETVGGDMEAHGTGLIKISLSPSGDLSILGNYEVAEGKYNFNLQNVVRRPFVIQSGSTLRWNGDPFDAQIDLRAIRQDRTSLWGMVSEVNGYEGQRYRVNLIMHLTGDLMNPNIEFDIEVPNAPVAWQEEIRNRLNDQDKLTENAFSILAGYGFVDPNGSIVEDVGSQGVNQLAGLMSSWANRSLGDIGDFNVSYQSLNSNPDAALNSEWEVGYSKQFGDDRWTLNTNVDIPVADAGASTQQQDITGDVEVEYKITEDGRFRARAFNRSNQNNPALVQLSSYSQGVGIFYRTDFNTWNDLIEKVFGYRPEETKVEQEE